MGKFPDPLDWMVDVNSGLELLLDGFHMVPLPSGKRLQFAIAAMAQSN
jgi:hypothetical protein